MPPSTSCPVPEIDRALSPYVNSNQDTAKIRRALAKHLSSHLKSTKPTLHHLDYECPNDSATINLRTSSLKETRIRYLHALEAKLKAQARHQELQASLDELQTQNYLENPVQSETTYDQEETRSYISLLRQRRRLAELQVIQSSLEKLLSASPPNSHKDPKTLVKQSLGEQPDIPVERLEKLSVVQEDDGSMFKLKKEVLEAKAAMDRAKTAKSKEQAHASANPSLEQQVFALSCARDELVAWVEGELSKLNEESVLMEDVSPVKQWPRDSAPMDVEDPEKCIRESYSRYTTSRSELINAHGSTQTTTPPTERPPISRTHSHAATEQATTSKTTNTISDIIPHIPSLARTARNERSLLQQAVYVQAQLSSADEELTEALTRLSDESHLLPSGSTAPTAWAKTATEAEKATRDFVEEHLLESQQEVNRIGAIVELCSLQSKVLDSR